MRHPKAIEWEIKLKAVFDRIDEVLEERYGRQYRLHPNRPERGATSNPEHDGLFNVGAAFTAGYGSEHGPGYVVEMRTAPSRKIPEEIVARMQEETSGLLKEMLPRAFPGQDLRVERDGPVFKIVGDLDLGEV